MVVPLPVRRDHEVADSHLGALAADRGMPALGLQHKPERRLCVPVRGSHLARQHELDTGEERGGHLRLPAKTRILEDQNAAHGLLRGDESGRFKESAPHRIESPQEGDAGALRFRGDDVAQDRPQGGQPLGLDGLVERGAFGALRRTFVCHARISVVSSGLASQAAMRGRRHGPTVPAVATRDCPLGRYGTTARILAAHDPHRADSRKRLRTRSNAPARRRAGSRQDVCRMDRSTEIELLGSSPERFHRIVEHELDEGTREQCHD